MSQVLRIIELTGGGASDIAAMDAVMAAAFDPAYGEAWTRGQCLGILSMPGVWLTLARSDGAIVGFALSRAIVDEVELLLLAVTPAHRGAGIGGALVRSVIADARGRDATKIHLEVRAGNEAIALYRRHGFAKTGERRAYYRGTTGRAFDAHSYALDL